MVGTWTCSEDEDFGSLGDNKVIVTAGTSGTPATFSDFVTADAAGEAVLMAATNCAKAMTLTYQIRPTMAIALTISFIIAAKTAEADWIYITGTDWDDQAQTEAIDIAAGNGTYTSTNKFRTITQIDISDANDGTGTAAADGTVRVTQPQWGFIWDYKDGIYRVDSNFDIGNGSTSTYFTTTQEICTIARAKKFLVKTAATFHMGTRTDSDNTTDGSIIVLDCENQTTASWMFEVNAGTFNFYDSTIMSINILNIYSGYFALFASSTSDMVNSRFKDLGVVYFWGGTHTISHVDISGTNLGQALYMSTGNTVTIDDLTISSPPDHYLFSSTNGSDITIRNFKGYGTVADTGLDIGTRWNGDIILIDPEIDDWTISNADTAFQNSYLYRQYSCDITVTDKDGSPIEGATVLCEDKDDTQVFSVQTQGAPNTGEIVTQEITYIQSQYTGGGEVTTTMSPHKFTISKVGYETLVYEDITVDQKINWWNIELQDLLKDRVPIMIDLDGNLYKTLAEPTMLKL